MPQTQTIAFYNVENLFDTVDNPTSHDQEFTPAGERHWDEARYQTKINKIALVIDTMGKVATGEFPAIIGLAEIENAHVLKDLIHHSDLVDAGYGFVHFDSLDERGIDTAFLYRKAYFTPTFTEPLRIALVDPEGNPDFSRDILHIQGTFLDDAVHLFICHFPSKRNQDINKASRDQIALFLKRKTDALLEENPLCKIVLMGDFNVYPDSELMANILQTKADPLGVKAKEFLNPMQNIHASGKGTLVYKSQWNLFDQILFSQGFLAENPGLNFKEAKIFDHLLIKERQGDFKGNPFRTFVGKRYFGGYSDHFPVYALLEKP